MDNWNKAPESVTGEFEWQHAHNPSGEYVAVRLDGGLDTIYIDAHQLYYLLKQLADKHGPDKIIEAMRKGEVQ